MGNSRMGREQGRSGLARIYEGEACLARLLEAAGAKVDAGEVKRRLAEAQDEGREAAQVFPTLFEGEPRFSSPEQAMRLYSNLFGLWDRLASGGAIEPGSATDAAEEVEQEEQVEVPEPAPAPAAVDGGSVGDGFVEAAWKHLADLPPRELERWLHRYENTQPELSEHVRHSAGDSVSALETADTLSFELWAMLTLARPGRKPRVVARSELERALEATDDPEPALVRYVDEVIEEAKLDEEAPLAEADAERVRRLARAVIRGVVAAQG